MPLFKVTRKRLALGLGGLAVLLIGVIFAIGWYYSGEIESGGLKVKHDPDKFEVEVVDLEDGLITLRLPGGKDPRKEPTTVGIEWPDGYGRVGEIVEVDGVEVVRAYERIEGSISVGDMVRFDKYAFPGDPESAHGISFEEVVFASPTGELRAWYVAGSDDTWAIFVHGKGAGQGEALRMLPVAEEAGLPSLVITYRNDDGAPEDPSGRYQWGRTEWDDLEAAARYALDNGADDLLLVGYSMGGGIVVSFLSRSPLADRVVGMILDSPMLDFEATVDLAADRRNLPGFLTAVAKRITGYRFDVNWGELDYVKRSDDISAPVLLFHGDADEKVPVSLSTTLAERLPDLVTYVPFSGAPHVGSWNMDPERYETAVRDFVETVTR